MKSAYLLLWDGTAGVQASRRASEDQARTLQAAQRSCALHLLHSPCLGVWKNGKLFAKWVYDFPIDSTN